MYSDEQHYFEELLLEAIDLNDQGEYLRALAKLNAASDWLVKLEAMPFDDREPEPRPMLQRP